MHLDEDLLGAHDLDDLADVGARLLQQAQLVSEQSDAGVVVIALGLEAAQSSLPLEDLELHGLDLIVIVLVQRHLGRWLDGVESRWERYGELWMAVVIARKASA